jgi:hypothetical protein
MRRSTLRLALGLAVLLATAGPTAAQTPADPAECRQSCKDATVAFLDQCKALAGPARGYCRRVARAYSRCCKRKFCRGRVQDVASCIRGSV